LYKFRHFATKWRCTSHCSPKCSGKRSNRFCPNSNVASAVVRPKTIAVSLKPFSGSSKPARAGVTCPKILASVPASPGSGSALGKSKASGCDCGARFSPNWMRAANWTGKKVSWMAVSLPPKRGRRSWQNQAWQGHEVDGGGRRPRCSSGKLPGLCVPVGSQAARKDAE